MDGMVGNLIKAFSEIWKTIGIPQKVSIVLIGMVAIGTIVAIMMWGSQTDWQILYADLDRKTASEVQGIVEDEGVEFKLLNGGKTIMVPTKQVNSLRNKVATAGVKVDDSARGGWSLYDVQKLGEGEREQQIKFQRAKQDELEMMIERIPGVESCTIMLNIPPRKVFGRKSATPSASIMLVMDSRRMMGRTQVKGIRNLVSTAIDGMSPNDVTIQDNYGQLLARRTSPEERANGDLSGNMEKQSAIESELREKAESVLRPIFGDDSVVAVVTATVDWSNINRVEEKIVADSQVPIRTEKTTETSTVTEKQSSGAASASANLPTQIDVSNPTASSSQESSGKNDSVEKEVTEYAVPKTIETTVIKGGKITDVSVAVTIKQPEGTTFDDDAKKKYIAMVQKAVGAKAPEDIQMIIEPFVEVAPFVPPAKPIDTQILSRVEWFTTSPLVRPIIGLIILLFLFRLFKKYFTKAEVEGTELASYGREVREVSEVSERDEEFGQVMALLEEKSSNSPQEVANVMEGWLISDGA